MRQDRDGVGGPVTLLYGLVAFGQIRFHKIDGHRHVAGLLRGKKTYTA